MKYYSDDVPWLACSWIWHTSLRLMSKSKRWICSLIWSFRTQLSKTPSANHHLNLRPAPPTSRALSWVDKPWMISDIHWYATISQFLPHLITSNSKARWRSTLFTWSLILPRWAYHQPPPFRNQPWKWNVSGFFGLKLLLQSEYLNIYNLSLSITKWISSTGSITSTGIPSSTRPC